MPRRIITIMLLIARRLRNRYSVGTEQRHVMNEVCDRLAVAESKFYHWGREASINRP